PRPPARGSRPRGPHRAHGPGHEGPGRPHLRAGRAGRGRGRERRAPARRGGDPGRHGGGHHGGEPVSPAAARAVLLLSGPNLNLLGEREPEVYGAATLEDHVATARMTAKRVGLELEAVQSNREGDL